jgi:flagellar P-ring protein precursor FlgI
MTRLTKFLLAAAAIVVPMTPAHAERIRDLGTFQGIRSNQLVGYGIVVGLEGTGDDNLEYAAQAVKGMSSRMGLQLPPGVQPGLKNAAAVMITADLPAFAKPGQRIDITVSALGKAKSLRGGALVLTPLTGADGQIYAMAQGNLAVGGLGVSARDGSKLSVNVPTVGRIPMGASVERAVATGFDTRDALRFNLNDADFLTAKRVRDEINTRFGPIATMEDAVTISIAIPVGADRRAQMIAAIEMLDITPAEAPARVIVNSRTGTVVVNNAVRLAPAAVSHGTLVIRIDEDPRVSQPEPFSRGETKVEENSTISIDQSSHHLAVIAPGPSLTQIVDSLNKLGVSPPDLVAILEALRQAGSLKAELVVI